MTETFTQTSTDLYTRHKYKLVYTNGESVIFDNYRDLQESWWNTSPNLLSHVEVLDKKKQKGFR